jgi:hypothetical protein
LKWKTSTSIRIASRFWPDKGFHVYLNGHKIHTYIWWQDKPQYGTIVLEEEQIKHLKKGKNVLAVYANDQYDLKSPERYAAIDVWIEGITKADQGEARSRLGGSPFAQRQGGPQRRFQWRLPLFWQCEDLCPDGQGICGGLAASTEIDDLPKIERGA